MPTFHVFRWQPFVVVIAVVTAASNAAAQERRGIVAELAGGVLTFADDAAIREGFVSGVARVYVSPRVSLGPEIAYVSGDAHNHLIVTGNATFDLVSPRRDTAVVPFLVGGVGLFRSRWLGLGEGAYSSSEGAFTAGGGVRARVSHALSVGAEARVGWELHMRVNGFVAIRLR